MASPARIFAVFAVLACSLLAQDTDSDRATALTTTAQGLIPQKTPEAWHKAAADFQEAAALWHKLNQPAKESEALQNAASVHGWLHELTEMSALLEQAKALEGPATDSAARAVLLVNFSFLHSSQGDPMKAIADLEQARSLYKQINFKPGELQAALFQGIAYEALATSKLQAGDTAAALTLYEKALPLFQQSGDAKLTGNSFVHLGQTENRVGTPEALQKAATYFTQAIPLLQSAMDPVGETTAWWALGDVRDSLNQTEAARDAYLKALPLLPALKDEHVKAYIFRNLGNAENKLQHYPEAIGFYHRALPLFASTHDSLNQFYVGMKLAAAHEALGQKEEARAVYQSVATASHEAGDFSREAMAVSSIGLIHLADRHWQQALDAFSNAQKLRANLGDKESEAQSWGLIGTVYLSRGEYKLKLDADKHALDLLASTSNRKLKAAALYAVGDSYNGLHNWLEALTYLNKALEITENAESKASILDEIGEVYYNQSRLDEALKFETQAREIALTLDKPAFVNRISTDIALTYQEQGNETKAREIFENALADARQRKDIQQQCTSLHNLGALHQSFGDHAAALPLFEESIALALQDKERRQAATTMSFLGMTYHALGRDNEALQQLSRAVSEMHALEDKSGESVALNDLALFYSDTGQAQQALDKQNQAIALMRDINDQVGVAAQLRNLGTIYQAIGDFVSAETYFTEALEIQKSFQDDHAQALTENSLGALALNSGNPKRALREFQAALPILRTFGDRVDEAIALSNIANALIDAGDRETDDGDVAEAASDFARAVATEEDSLRIAREVHHLDGQALAFHGLGSAYERSGDLVRALDSLRQARPLWHEIHNPTAEAKSLSLLARVEHRQGNENDALRDAGESIKLLESQRSSLASEDLRAYYSASLGPYQTMIDVFFDKQRREPAHGYDRLAFETSEAARARSLLDLLAQSRAVIRRGIDPALRAHEQALQNSIDSKATRLRSAESSESKKLHVEIEDQTAELERVRALIRSKNPAYAALAHPQTLTLPEIQKQVLDPNTVLLEYSLGRERSFLFFVTPTSLQTYELPKRREIVSAANDFYQEVSALNKDRSALRAAASTLSHLLLDPVSTKMKGMRLVIVGDGELCGMPFTALPDPATGEPLLVQHEIITVPSASTLALLRRQIAGRKPAPKELAVIADPIFESSDPRLPGTAVAPAIPKTPLLAASATRDANFLQRLPHTREEARAILALSSTAKSLALLDFNADKAAVMSERLANYHIIHFATHGAVDDTHPQLSGLVLSLYDHNGQPIDGFLRLNDIFNMHLSADLVVLSACQSGQGKLVAGEGVMGLTRGFFFAGVPSLVISLWNVNDAATAKLMTRFYSEMLGSPRQRPAAALRAAQRWMISQPQWQDPYFWAPFTLQGEWK